MGQLKMNKTIWAVIIRLAQTICVLGILFFIFFWLMAIASGHTIPLQTLVKIVVIEIILIALTFFLSYLINKIRKGNR